MYSSRSAARSSYDSDLVPTRASNSSVLVTMIFHTRRNSVSLLVLWLRSIVDKERYTVITLLLSAAGSSSSSFVNYARTGKEKACRGGTQLVVLLTWLLTLKGGKYGGIVGELEDHVSTTWRCQATFSSSLQTFTTSPLSTPSSSIINLLQHHSLLVIHMTSSLHRLTV